MRTWQAIGAGGRAILVGLGAIGLSAVGYTVWRVAHDVAVTDTPAAVAAPLPETAAPPAAAAPDPTPSVEATPPVQPPQFGTWRVAMDGAAVVAGTAQPGAKVSVLVNGAAIAQIDATPSGEFVALFTVPPTDQPSLMSLSMTLADGQIVPSSQTVALEAIAVPMVVAEATPDTPATATETPPPKDTAPTAILLSEAGAVVLQDPVAPDTGAPADVAIETISYTPQGDVQLGGRAQAGSFVRIYLDNLPVQTVLVPVGGQWLTTLSDTAPGVYTLRADQIDAAGKVTSRFETPFKRETLAALAAAAGVPPADPVVAPAASDGAAEPPAQIATADPAPPPQTDAPATPRVTIAEPPPPLPSTAADVSAVADAPPAATGTVVADLPEPQKADPVPAVASPVSITVQPGFTLWGIAQQSYGDGVMYVQVFEANKDKIRNPDLIYPGQVFTMPGEDGG